MLGKGDFKALLKWRLKMRELRQAGGEKEEKEEEEEKPGNGKKAEKAAPKSAVEEEVGTVSCMGAWALPSVRVRGCLWVAT